MSNLEEKIDQVETPPTTSTRTIGGTSGVAFGVLCVWLAGRFGVAMSAEVGAVIGSIAFTFGACLWELGLIGVLAVLIKGRRNV